MSEAEKPLSPELERATKGVMLNIALARVDAVIKEQPPAMQMGICMLACALCFRRMMKVLGVRDGLSKRKYLRAALRDFENKIREHGFKEKESV